MTKSKGALVATMAVAVLAWVGTYVLPPISTLLYPMPAHAQFYAQGTWGGTSAGSANAQTITINNATSLADLLGVPVTFIPGNANTAAATLTINSFTATAVNKPAQGGLVALSGGEFETGQPVTVMYDGTRFDITSPIDTVASGTIAPFGGTTAPNGYVLCFGQAVSRTGFAALFSAIGTTWGVGDGSTTFNVPDLRGYLVAGSNNMGGSAASVLTTATRSGGWNGVGLTGGNEQETLTVTQMPSHIHANILSDPGHTHVIAGVVTSVLNNLGGAGSNTGVVTNSVSGASVTGVTITNASQGGGAAHPIVQPTATVNYIIKN